MSIDRDYEHKNERFNYADFYRHNIEKIYNLIESWFKMMHEGMMYFYNSDIVNQMRKYYEKSYKQYVKEWEEFYKNHYF
ncbi:MAG: hypothetical protein ACTHKC_05935 [Candidatus Nitrosocosmicus sp.]